jgi:hypothetical protein
MGNRHGAPIAAPHWESSLTMAVTPFQQVCVLERVYTVSNYHKQHSQSTNYMEDGHNKYALKDRHNIPINVHNTLTDVNNINDLRLRNIMLCN